MFEKEVLPEAKTSCDPDLFQKTVIAKYMEGLPNYLKLASDRYYSPAAFTPNHYLQPTGWGAEVNRNPHGKSNRLPQRIETHHRLVAGLIPAGDLSMKSAACVGSLPYRAFLLRGT